MQLHRILSSLLNRGVSAHSLQLLNCISVCGVYCCLCLCQGFEGVHTCKKTDTLAAVMKRLVEAEVHRLIIVDEEERVCGVISLSDILAYLVLRPAGVPVRK